MIVVWPLAREDAMIWLVLVVVVVGAIVALVVVNGRASQRVVALDAAHAQAIAALKAAQEEDRQRDAEEHERRVKRIERDALRRTEQAHLRLVGDLLPGVDSLEQAIRHARAEDPDGELVRGLELVLAELERALERHDVTRVSADPGHSFDPNVHEAVGVIETAEVPAQAIAETLRAGWTHPAKTIRPAMVQVARAPASAPAHVAADEEVVLDLSAGAEDEAASEEEVVFSHEVEEARER